MNDQILTKEQQADLLNALTQTANNEVWNKSPILRVIGKQVTAIRDDFEKLINPTSTQAQAQPQTLNAKEEKVKVFVSIYCARGTDIKNWERLLPTLPGQLITRPVYTDENAVINLIKSKTNKENEAYLCTEVPSNCIVPQDKPFFDKLGNPLVSLKGKPLPEEYHATFYHQSGKYQYIHKKLVKLGN